MAGEQLRACRRLDSPAEEMRPSSGGTRRRGAGAVAARIGGAPPGRLISRAAGDVQSGGRHCDRLDLVHAPLDPGQRAPLLQPRDEPVGVLGQELRAAALHLGEAQSAARQEELIAAAPGRPRSPIDMSISG